MKRVLSMLCLCLLFLGGCQRTRAVTATPQELAARVTEALQDEMPFTAADEDYIDSNFEGLSGKGAVYFGDGDDVCEFGVFLLEGTAKSTALSILRAYITTETEALASMAALYPSEELQERLLCYQNAYVGENQGYIYYLVMDEDEMITARAVLEKP